MTQDNVQIRDETVIDTVSSPSRDLQTGLRKIPDGERFRSSQTIYSENTVQVVYSFRRSANDPVRYEKTSWLDFGSVTREQLLVLASRSIVIDVQAILRRLQQSEMMKVSTLQNIDVQRDILSATRIKADPEATSIKILAKKYNMSEDDVVSLFER